MMTAPLRSDPTVVNVALGDRAYDIIIGRGLIASLGARIAALRPGARAAIVTRGFAEMTRLATGLGAQAETLAGLSGLGDLILTATSPQSRNFRYGCALGRAEAFDPGVTGEGAATARAGAAAGAWGATRCRWRRAGGAGPGSRRGGASRGGRRAA